MIEIGKYQKLKGIKATPQGIYFTDEEESEEILLPVKFVPDDFYIGDELELYIYTDSEDRIIATTQRPKITAGEFGSLKVIEVNKVGAFLDNYLDKDLLVPFREQKVDMERGQYYVVYQYLDEDSGRLVASSKLDKFLVSEVEGLENNQEVDLLIVKATELGYNAIINNRYKGLIYNNEVFRPIKKGDQLKGYIKNIREDGKIDLSLQQQGYGHVEPSAATILEKLEAQRGFIPLTDKSSPEEIIRAFNMSKKTFKKALGQLYRKRQVRLEEDGIYLVEIR